MLSNYFYKMLFGRKMEDADDASAQFLDNFRFWIQRVLVPIVVIIGVGGNIVTVVVLTRRRMRCTSTIYLTALAIADIIYLIFVLLLSFEHYENIHNQKYELYWRFYGITHWLCDAASSTSVWLTVSFTIERYIAVCHPMRGKVHCTESRAKNIITVVGILCLLSTASTTFEHQLKLDENAYAKFVTHGICHLIKRRTSLQRCRALNPSTSQTLFPGSNRTYPMKTSESQLPAPIVRSEFRHPRDVSSQSRGPCDSISPSASLPEANAIRGECADNDTRCIESLSESSSNSSKCCDILYLIDTEPTELGSNETYQKIFYWFSSVVFALVPLVLIATFNCFLVRAVYKSQRQRKTLTNSQEQKHQSNENRITLLLISVVILFLLCQTPTAIFLLYDAFDQTDHGLNITKRVLGNLFNFLITLNAACNFILYCVLSDKFRRTFRLVFCERKVNRRDMLAHSRTTRSTRFTSLTSGGGTSASMCSVVTGVGTPLQTPTTGGASGRGKYRTAPAHRNNGSAYQPVKTPRSIEVL